MTGITDNLQLFLDLPDGIKKLRELILTLAMQGKLVPQDPNDQPASELLKEIEAEKKRLLKEGKIKKQEPLPPIKPEEIPYSLPKGWEWVRLGSIGVVGSSIRVHQKDWTEEGIPFYRAREIVKLSNNGFVNNELFISEKVFSVLSKKGLVPEEHDIMLTGVGTIGVPYVVKENDLFYFKDASVLIFKNYFKLFSLYLYKYFKSVNWNNCIHIESMGTTVHTLTISRASKTLLPLPPLVEQKRVVAKIDELMVLCDQLEALKAERDQNRVTVHTVAINNLLSSPDPVSFDSSWQFITRHFNELYSVKENVAELRKAILLLAVMGKLVPQDPNDQPASELLKEIEAEKKRLVKEGKIKKQEPLPPIKPEEFPYSLPKGWEWVRLGEILIKFGAGSTPLGGKSVYTTNGVIFLRSQNIWDDGLKLDDVARINLDIHKKMSGTKVIGNDLLLNITGASIGRSTIYPYNFEDANVSQHVAILRLVEKNLAVFIHKTIISRYFQEMIMDRQVGVSREGLSMSKLKDFPIPLPPLAEQKRIVTKIDELMALCDLLEKQLGSVELKKSELVGALLAGV